MKYLSDFFAFVTERERIRIRKQKGYPKPWTEISALRDYRYCNVFREDDTTTQWIKLHIRDPLKSSERVLLALTIARFINRIESLECIYIHLLNEDLTWPELRKKLFFHLNGRHPLITGAYMVKTPPGMDKLNGLLDIFDPLAKDSGHLIHHIEPGETELQAVHERLMDYPYIGSFMAYEIVTDLRHTDFLSKAPDINTWAALGPGAARGIGRVVYGNPLQYNYNSSSHQKEMLELMMIILIASREKENWPWPRKKWEMREVEHTLCEFDKYMRVTNGEGTPKQLYNGG